MPKIVVKLPANRDRAGELHVENDEGRILCGPFPVCGRADGEQARANGNASRNRLLPYGDAPLGSYRIPRIVRTGKGTPFPVAEFGPHGALVLNPVAGEAALAEAAGRFVSLIHGGGMTGGMLRPSCGSLRLSGEHQKRLISAIRRLKDVTLEVLQALDKADAAPIQVNATCAAADPPSLSSAETQVDLTNALTRRDLFRRVVAGAAVSMATPLAASADTVKTVKDGTPSHRPVAEYSCPGGIALQFTPTVIAVGGMTYGQVLNYNTEADVFTLKSASASLKLNPTSVSVGAATVSGGQCYAAYSGQIMGTALSVPSKNPVQVTAYGMSGDTAYGYVTIQGTTSPGSVTVSGTVTLQACIKSAVTKQSVTFSFYPVGGGSPITVVSTLNSNGTFGISNIPKGKYNLYVKARKWLAVVASVNASTGNVKGLKFTLKAGDIANHNAVDSTGYAMLRAAFGTTSSSSNWTTLGQYADLNCDGQVDDVDFAIFRSNYGDNGAPIP